MIVVNYHIFFQIKYLIQIMLIKPLYFKIYKKMEMIKINLKLHIDNKSKLYSIFINRNYLWQQQIIIPITTLHMNPHSWTPVKYNINNIIIYKLIIIISFLLVLIVTPMHLQKHIFFFLSPPCLPLPFSKSLSFLSNFSPSICFRIWSYPAVPEELIIISNRSEFQTE